MKPEEAADLVRDHLTGPVAAQPWVQHVEHDPELNRWYLRFTCDGRDATTVYFDLRPRSLRYEVYFLPDPSGASPAPSEGKRLELYRWLLRRNHHEPYNARFSIGPDGDIYLTGRVLYQHLDEEELDRLIGVCYETVETWFQTAVTLGFR